MEWGMHFESAVNSLHPPTFSNVTENQTCDLWVTCDSLTIRPQLAQRFKISGNNTKFGTHQVKTYIYMKHMFSFIENIYIENI